jgi:hypothetical protein
MKRSMFLTTFVVLGLMLLLTSLSCGSIESGRGPVKVESVFVEPASGSGSFQLVVRYTWSSSNPSGITCFYMTPDAKRVEIGTIRPGDITHAVLGAEGSYEYTEKLPFTAQPRQGATQPEVYTAECWADGPPAKAEFTVTPAMAQATTMTTEATTTTTTKATTTTSTEQSTTTIVSVPAYNLQVEMTIHSKGGGGRPYEMHALWSGEMTLGPDGSLRGKLPGEIDAVVPLDLNGEYPEYKIDVTFNVDATGFLETTAAGPVLHIRQNLADHEVHPVTAVAGDIDLNSLDQCEDAVVEAAPKWLSTILTELTFQGTSLPLTQDVSAGIWAGRAILSQAP